VAVDGQQLTQVYMNLILNAAQASKSGSTLIIRCGVRGDASGGMKNVYVDFVDQGTGIKPKDLPNIFQPFFTTKHEGTGLGLATSKRIVEAHQGEILVHSEEGKGSTFTVLIPIVAPRDLVTS
jgi:signal transduction histidine kinase